jgi:dUTP pyrophosphatase
MNLPAYEPCMRFEKTHLDAKLPEKNFDSDAGWDLFSVESCVIPANGKNVVPVGLKLAYIEPGYWIKVSSRSGLSFKNSILAHPGVIDQNYRGDLGVLLYNHSSADYTVNKGDRVAQLVLHFNIQMKVEWGTVQQTDRGEKGFGSSGK